MNQKTSDARTAYDAGWHLSRYNLTAPIETSNDIIIVNLIKNTVGRYSVAEQFLLNSLEEMSEDHPAISYFASQGIIANYDEYAYLESAGRAKTALSNTVHLTICPTMGCNFDCSYCYELHTVNRMSKSVQDDVINLAERLLQASRAKEFNITWFGGEPLLEIDIIRSMSERLIQLSEKYGVTYESDMITNGYLLSEKNASILNDCKIHKLQITIDGLGETHDKTRHLAGGGSTFDKIIENISHKELPFQITIRHNIHNGNKDEIDSLDNFIKEIAEKSGNKLRYYPYPVYGSETADSRGNQVELLSDKDSADVSLRLYQFKNFSLTGHFCNASNIWSMAIDPDGNLMKCLELMDDTSLAFGNANSWDPLRPLETATNPDGFTMYLKCAVPLDDEECSSCVWLPLCSGGCPRYRLFDKKACLPFKNEPESYAKAIYESVRRDSNPRPPSSTALRGLR